MTGPEDWQRAADRLATEEIAAGRPTGWFERLYAAAGRGETTTPWNRSGAYPPFAEFARRAELDGRGKSAVVVGCGLGADAAFAAELGYRTLAFDIAPSAVEQARSRTAGSGVEFQVADLLDLPAGWPGSFDLVVEIFTVQAMPPELHQRAAVQVASLVAPGGLLVAVGAVAEDDVATLDGPPFPLTTAEIDAFRIAGLRELEYDRLSVDGAPRWRLVLTADGG